MAKITLLGRSRRRRAKHRRGLRGASECRTSKGKLKKGWRLMKGGRCVRAKRK